MAQLFYMGGPLFMGILTFLFVILLAISIYFFLSITSGKAAERINFRHQLTYLKSVGLFTMITGILGQLIGLMTAFKTIERVGDISPAMLAGGLKVSMITTLYGILIYLTSILIWFLLDLWYHKKSTS
ncbi:MAG: MotA/TolQ/ExbB proton channel family protein [Bacteroidota bacterium]